MIPLFNNALIRLAQVLKHLCVFGMAMCWVWAAQAAPLAGTVIVNQAQATYVDAPTGKAALLTSNIVELQVQQIASFTLTTPQSLMTVPGGTSNLSHQIRNTGNGPDTFNLSTTLLGGTLVLTNVTIYADLNGDGIPDNFIPITSTPILAAGAVFNFVVSATAAGTALSGDTQQIGVNASGTATAVPAPTQSNTDTLTISNQAVLTITKAFDIPSGPSPSNTNITATLTIVNIGNAVATNVTLSDIIGVANAAPVFDSTGMSYVPNSAKWDAVPLNDLGAGNPAGVTYSATTLAAKTTLSAVFASLVPGAAIRLSFQLTVLPGLAAGSLRTNNVATVSYAVGLVTQSVNSNMATYTVVPSVPQPDLTLTKSHVGNFTEGFSGVFNFVVSNIGVTPSAGVVTVSDTLQAGLIFDPTTSGGVGWMCSAVLQVVTCSNPTVVPAGGRSTNLAIGVIPNAVAVAASPFPNNALVAGGGEPIANTANNGATDPVVIVGPAATVSGLVWLDNNHNKALNAGELGLGGWQVELLNAAGQIVRTALTQANGQYTISLVMPGNGYQLRFRDPSTNIFYASPVIGNGTPPVGGVLPTGAQVTNGVITGLNLVGGVNVVQLDLPLDPSGVVYDSVTRLAVPGAMVKIVCTTCAPAFDPAIHLFGGLANQTQTVGTTGYYQFLLLAGAPAGLYQLQVTAPAGYISPSTLIPAQTIALTPPAGVGKFPVQAQDFPPPVGSPTTYYLSFNLFVGAQDAVNNHIPLDPTIVPGSGLLVSKTASRTTVEIGDFIDYTVIVKNVTTVSLAPVMLVDNLPRGLTYQLGTSRLNGAVLVDPVGGMGPSLTFAVGTLAAGGTATLTYRVAVGITAAMGTATNSVQASSGVARSNIAQARVQIVQGVFSDKAYILGTVYMDCNRNHIQEPDEPGIPGVRLYLENGTYGVTDTDGKYSFYGVDPRTHHLKVDKTTLPIGALLEIISNRHAGVGGGRFVDLKNSELHRADFASDSCTDEVMNEVKVRHSKDTVSETERMLNYRLNPNPAIIAPADARILPASGELIKTTPSTSTANNYQSIAQNSGLNSVNSSLPSAPVAPVAQVDMDSLLPNLDNKLGFIDLKDGDVMPMAQTVVRIKGLMGSVFRLSVNGKEVDNLRVGKRSKLADKQLEAWEYVGVALNPGENVLVLTQLDPFGNERDRQTITLIAPDQLATIKIEAPSSIEANGRVPAHFKVKLQDKEGVLVTSRTYLTLEAIQGHWEVKDLDPKEPGIQIAMENGEAEFDLLPPSVPGQETVRILSGVLKGEHLIAYLPELRPMIVAGIVEGALNMHSLKAGSLTPVTAQDSFDQEIRHLSQGNAAGNAGVRAAMFLKGKVKGEYLLTLAYDSDKNIKDRLFRDIQPDEFYPVYGDSSNKGFDAQSTSRLYVRVDQGKSFLMYGDFSTQNMIPARSLSQYNRSLTGVKEHYENAGVMVNAFASRDTVRQVIQQLPADGTSGPYQLTNNGALINSEKVEILTRDRNQTNVILKLEPQTRFTDYEIEQFTGRLLFKGPIASLDANLNPRSIRITYEMDQGGTAFWVTGVDGQAKLNSNVEVGMMMVSDSNPMQASRIMGSNVTVKLAEKTVLVGELAHTNTALLGGGKAQRIELRQDGTLFNGRIYSGRSDTTFDNAASLLSKGRMESGAKGTIRVDATTSLSGEAISSGDRLTGARRDGVLVKIEKSINDYFRVEAGMRKSHENMNVVGVPTTNVTSARLKAISQIPQVKGLSVNAEYEQDVHDSTKKVAALGAEYQMMNRGRLYARHEFISSLTSAFALNTTQRANSTVFGLDTDYTPNTHVFSEYRARGVMDGRQAEAAVGLRNKWQVAEGLRINTGIERVTNISGGAGRASQAYTGAVEYTRDPFWKGSARLEYRTSDTSDGWLNSVDIAKKLSESWTVIGKQVFSESATKGATSGVRILHRMQAGLAWRDMEEHDWNALTKFEHRRESDTTSAATIKRVMDIISLHVNYQSDSDWQASGHYAAKWLTDESFGLSSHSNAHLASGRVMWDITERWDAGVLGSVMGDRGFRSIRYGLGAETGYLLQANLWLSIGYNFFGFKDTDLIGQNATDKGFFVRLRFKFDEDLFSDPNRYEGAARNCKP
ncbi:MAG: SdrD B-like domain-containing protein [Gallionella sp.]|nr:SdrD B-like domain-containing protein [Gallionella sp.]